MCSFCHQPPPLNRSLRMWQSTADAPSRWKQPALRAASRSVVPGSSSVSQTGVLANSSRSSPSSMVASVSLDLLNRTSVQRRADPSPASVTHTGNQSLSTAGSFSVIAKLVLFTDASRAHQLLDVKHMVILTYFFGGNPLSPHRLLFQIKTNPVCLYANIEQIFEIPPINLVIFVDLISCRREQELQKKGFPLVVSLFQHQFK